ncbi:MAG: sterol carrier protein domain-containing protein, partial [Candidatus Limnocylindrales bacterium]
VTPEQAVTSFPPIFDAVRAVTPGFLSRTPAWWQAMVADPSFNRRGAGPKFLLLFEVDGAPEGYLIYRVKGEWENGATKSTLEVRELMAMTTRAERELWRFCFGHDLILTVRAQHRAVDDPLLLQLNEPRRLRATLGDGLWLRIVDIPGALAARGYLAADALTIDLSDGFIPDLAGRWRLDTRGDAVAVARTGEPAELALDITDLGALSLGAFSATDLARSDRVRELRPGALHRADGLFGWHRRPWCAEVF